MRFSLALAMTQPGRILTLSKAAEAAGWHGVTMPESVFYPEEVSAKYPYSADGQRFWPSDADWVDPWVGIPAIAASTGNVARSAPTMSSAVVLLRA